MKKNLCILFTIIMFSCNNSSNNEPVIIPTDPNTDFFLFEPNRFSDDFTLNFPLEGKDNNGNQLYMSNVISTMPQTTINNESVIPCGFVNNFTNSTTGIQKTVIGTNYYIVALDGIINIQQRIDSVEYNIQTREIIPIKAKIGNSGVAGIYLDINNNKIENFWALEDAGNNTAYLIETCIKSDQWGRILSKTISKTKIKTTGEKLHIELKVTDPNTNYEAVYNSITIY